MASHRIVFFSKGDLAVSDHLKRADELLPAIDLGQVTDMNDLLELCHCKKYLDNEMFLTTWNDETRLKYIDLTTKALEKTKACFGRMDSAAFEKIVPSLHFEYHKMFWTFFNDLNIYKQIDPTVFHNTIEKEPHHLIRLLVFPKISSHFGQEVKEIFIRKEDAAEWLLDNHKVANIKEQRYHFPKALTMQDREKVLSDYITGKEPNLNYLHMIETIKDSDELKISLRVRLSAKKKAEELRKKVLSGPGVAKFGVNIGLSKSQEEPLIYKYQNLEEEITYSESYLNSLTNTVDLFHCFKELFGYTDSQSLISMVRKESELMVLERIASKVQHHYPFNFAFRQKMLRAYSQLRMLNIYLEKSGRSIETLMASFIKDHLSLYPGLENLTISFPASTATWLEKVRTLAPELEFLLKQYELFTAEGKIDFDLLQISSTPLNIGEVKSLSSFKYLYPESDEINILKNFFFSDQSPLYYFHETPDQLESFYDRLQHTEVSMAKLALYQQDAVKFLIEKGHLHIDENGFIAISRPIQLFLVNLFYESGALNYWNFGDEERFEMDQMIEQGWATKGNTLLTKDEISYFNFYLNKKEFTNGYDIRNRYLHGTNLQSEEQQEIDYYRLLHLIILALLKIEDDLQIAASQETSNF